MLQSKITKNRERPKDKRTTPIRILNASAAGTVLTLSFETPVIVKRTPKIETDVVGAAPVSAQATNPTTVEVAFDADISAATSMTLPFQDLGVRNTQGGFIADLTFQLAA